MTQLASLLRISLLATTAIALASACGGQSVSGDRGRGQCGTTAHAGATGEGPVGSGAGGASSDGSGAGGSGVAGSRVGGNGGGAGAPAEECYAAPESRTCEGYPSWYGSPRWYHDPSTGICRPFVYGGCGGNKNRYPTLEDCNKACPGGAPNYDACNAPSDCVVTGAGPCDICDDPSVTSHDLIAYNRQYANFLECAVAPPIAPPGGPDSGVSAPIACAPCPPPPADQGTLKYFVPDCVAGQCVVQYLPTSPVAACKTNNECRLRHGTGCCEGCSNDQLVSVRNDGSFEKLVCGIGPVGCPACIAPPSDAYWPYCGPAGYCEVVHGL